MLKLSWIRIRVCKSIKEPSFSLQYLTNEPMGVVNEIIRKAAKTLINKGIEPIHLFYQIVIV